MEVKKISSFDKRTKIIATIGPSCESKEQLLKLFQLGVNVIRLNFSHGSYLEHQKRIEITTKYNQDSLRPVSILLDTKGPEIRVGKMKGDEQLIKANSEVIIDSSSKGYQEIIGDNHKISVSYQMAADLKKNDCVLLDDGKLELKVVKIEGSLIYTKAFNAHLLKTNKRVNLPGVKFSLPFLSKKDKENIKWGVEHKIDMIAASFVNSKEDILELRQLLVTLKATHVQVIAKIESQLGIKNIDEIIAVSDGIMIARGDLGLEIPYYDVPYLEKKIIRKCRKTNKIVIVATQMLESMTENPHPTRAEVTDVYYATELGADATMLSGETANGLYPEIAVSTMAIINKRAEMEFYSKIYYQKYLHNKLKTYANSEREQIAIKIAQLTKNNRYRFAIIFSTTGQLLKVVSSLRPNTNIIGVSKNKELKTFFGVWHSITMAKTENYFEIKKNNFYALQLAKQYGAQKGDYILLVRNDQNQEHVTEFQIKN